MICPKSPHRPETPHFTVRIIIIIIMIWDMFLIRWNIASERRLDDQSKEIF